MKLTNQLMRNRARCALHSVEILDLSTLQIDRIERLQSCPKLRILNLRNNYIDYISTNLESCHQLWKLDLSNNKVQNLEGLSRFVALGTLTLANNSLSWSELAKIRHMHILDLSLHGNPQLEKDPYYRIHVIDCLPNVWMLDGRIITSAERLQVQQFFHDSALTDHPVRHKLGSDKFTPTSRKKLEINGVYGSRTDHLMRRFPTNGALNIDVDRRRILYLAYNLQQDLAIEASVSKRSFTAIINQRNLMEELIEARKSERIQCNMLLLLVVSSLEFAIPTHLMQEVLKCTKLNCIGTVETMGLFLLPRDLRVEIVCLLLSAVKVDKDIGEEGGLYDKLYLCLYHSVSALTRLAHSANGDIPQRGMFKLFKDSKSLLASEVVQLMCIVPTYFEYIVKDAGVMNLTTVATSDVQIIDKISKLFKKMTKEEWDKKKQYETVAELILRAIQENAMNVINKDSVPKKMFSQEMYILGTHKALPRRPQSSPIFAADFHTTGRSSPDKRPHRIKSSKPQEKSVLVQAKLGDHVLLGPQNIGRVISVPEADIVLVQMDAVPAETGAMVSATKNPEEHYTYLDMRSLTWDYTNNYWRPTGTVGDRITMQTAEEVENNLVNVATVIATSESTGNVSTRGGGQQRVATPVHTPRVVFQGVDTQVDEDKQEEAVERNSSIEAKINSTIQLLLNEVDQQAASCSTDLPPTAVSATLKQQLNLRLEVDNDAAHDVDSTSPRSNHVNDKVNVRERPRSAKVRRKEQHEPLPAGMYESVQSAMRGLTHTLLTRQPYCHDSKFAHDGGSNHISVPQSSQDLSPVDSGDEDAEDEIIYDTNVTETKVSRRTSLESAEEIELNSLQYSQEDPSRPISSQSEQLHARPGTSQDQAPIEIPLASVEEGNEMNHQNTHHHHYTNHKTISHQIPAVEDESVAETIAGTDNTFDTGTDISLLDINFHMMKESSVPPKWMEEEQDRRRRDGETSSAGGYKVVDTYAKYERVESARDSSRQGGQQQQSEQQGRGTSRVTAQKVNLGTNMQPAKKKNTGSSPLAPGHQPRSMTPLDSRRIIVAADERSYRSPYQTARTEAWRKNPASNKTGSSRTNSPPPQRPCSPNSGGKPSSLSSGSNHAQPFVNNKTSLRSMTASNTKKNSQTRVSSSKHRQSVMNNSEDGSLHIKRGDTWLGGGRDLHWENMKTRPKSAHVPGWMEGLPPRPNSSAAVRAHKRSKPPNIVTPSSIAFENAFGRTNFDFEREIPYGSTFDYVSSNGFQGTSAAGYNPMRRGRRRDGVMCEDCEAKLRREEERWRQLVAVCGTDAESNPPPSPSDINCDHHSLVDVPMEAAEYETTMELGDIGGGGMKQVTFDGSGLLNNCRQW